MARKTFRRMFIRKSLNVFITIFGIIILNFVLIHMMPGNPVDNIIPRSPKFDISLKWRLVEKFHLNDTIPEQLGYYVWNTIRLDWGTSYQNQRPVSETIISDIRWTMLLVGISTIFTILIGMMVGALAAFRRGSAFDMGSTAVTLFFYGMPVFWLALILQVVFSGGDFLGMNWWPKLPPSGYYDTDRYGTELKWNIPIILSLAKYLILPSITLAVGTLAGVSLIMRSSLVDTMTEDYIQTARAKGLTDYQVLRRHSLPNGMPPMIALIAMDIAFVIGGAYQVEVVFNYPGIGYRTILSIQELDFPVLQFIVVIGGVAVVLANFVADILLYYIDPRIRIS
ncbi:MAG: ABC transporter permease [Thermoplasmatota archaeon]|nr:ABC transporter permease [Candidatus Thermoplasmatota archaeon]